MRLRYYLVEDRMSKQDSDQWVASFNRYSELGHSAHESMLLADADLALDGKSVR